MTRPTVSEDECRPVPLEPEKAGNQLLICGKELNPTYHQLFDHTESLLLEFDPSKISYKEMLEKWWRMHRPLHKNSCQYRSAVWYLNEEQKKIAEEHLAKVKSETLQTLYTDVEKSGVFYRAEEYHQDYVMKQSM